MRVFDFSRVAKKDQEEPNLSGHFSFTHWPRVRRIIIVSLADGIVAGNSRHVNPHAFATDTYFARYDDHASSILQFSLNWVFLGSILDQMVPKWRSAFIKNDWNLRLLPFLLPAHVWVIQTDAGWFGRRAIGEFRNRAFEGLDVYLIIFLILLSAILQSCQTVFGKKVLMSNPPQSLSKSRFVPFLSCIPAFFFSGFAKSYQLS